MLRRGSEEGRRTARGLRQSAEEPKATIDGELRQSADVCECSPHELFVASAELCGHGRARDLIGPEPHEVEGVL